MFSELEVGDVVVLPFFHHQENRQKGEARSVIILEKFDDACCIVPLSCQDHQEVNYEKCFTIDKNSPDGQQMGLICNSLVIVDRESQYPKVVMNKIIDKLGTCPDEVLDQIHELIRT